MLKARQAMSLLDGRAESPPESIVRVWLNLAGLPTAIPNLVITDATGLFVARVDLAFEEYKIAVEYEGRYHRESSQYAVDLDRRNRLQQQGFLIVHIEQEMLRSPVSVVQPVAAALRMRGWTAIPTSASPADAAERPHLSCCSGST